MIKIKWDTTRHWKSTYRPISIGVEDTDSDTAYCRAELYIKFPTTSTYVSTDILINGYENILYPGRFDFNLMEYCRNFVSPGWCPISCDFAYFMPGAFETSKFKIKVWAVKYHATINGLLYDDSNYEWSESFIGLGTITNDYDALTNSNSYKDIDRFVLGVNPISGTGGTNSCRPLTDKPNGNSNHGTYPLDNHVINVHDFPTDSLYSPIVRNKNKNVGIIILVYPIANVSPSMHWIPLKVIDELVRVPQCPRALEMLHLLQVGSPMHTIINASGQLVAHKVALCLMTSDNGATPAFWRHSNGNTRWYWSQYSDKKNNGDCNTTKFVFKNMRGGFDSFNCTGTATKEIAISGARFDSYLTDIGQGRGSHGRKTLWNEREDVHSVISQPLTREYTRWLEQLIASPQVWVKRVLEQSDAETGNNYLTPVNIEQGSYAVHNTEDNVNYVEFKYRLSNIIETQRG